MTHRPVSRPFPHVVADDFLSPDEIGAVGAAWPHPSWPGWHGYRESYHNKLASDIHSLIPRELAGVLVKMALAPAVAWLGGLAPVPAAVPDLSLHAAGLHILYPGGRVGRHQDAQRHPRLGLARVLSAVLYVHERWEAGWGGELLLQDDAGQTVTTVEPRPGRLVIFACRDAWHEVAAVRCPCDRTRRSLALFWYAADPAATGTTRALFADALPYSAAAG